MMSQLDDRMRVGERWESDTTFFAHQRRTMDVVGKHQTTKVRCVSDD